MCKFGGLGMWLFLYLAVWPLFALCYLSSVLTLMSWVKILLPALCMWGFKVPFSQAISSSYVIFLLLLQENCFCYVDLWSESVCYVVGLQNDRKTWDVVLDIQGPRIIFLEHFCDKNAIMVVVDFGKFHFSNQPDVPAAPAAAKTQESDDEGEEWS